MARLQAEHRLDATHTVEQECSGKWKTNTAGAFDSGD